MAGTTTNYGWTYPTSTDLVKDGATAIQTAAQGVDTTLFTALGGAYPGLRLVKKQTIGSAVASVAVTNAFSATYENYKIIVTGGSSSAQAYLGFTFTGGTSAYDYNFIYTTFASATVLGDRAQNNASFAYGGVGNTTNGLDLVMDIEQPFLAQFSMISCTINSDAVAGRAQGRHKAATSYSGFTITPQSGTITGGTIYVYGYGAS